MVPTTGTGSPLHRLAAKWWLMNPRVTYLVRQPGYQGVVHRPISQSLPVQPLFCAGNMCVPHFWVCQTVPPALSSALFGVEQTFARSHHGVSDNTQQITTQKAGSCTHQSTAKACIWWLRTTLANANSPYSWMVAPPQRFAMTAVHSPTRLKGGTKGGG